MKAKVTSTIQKIPLQIINDPKQLVAAETGELTVKGKPVLIVKNGNTDSVVAQIYMRFANTVDTEGKPFEFSRKFRGLTDTDPIWKSRKKVSGSEFEAYILGWFQPVEKISTPDGEALVLLSKLPIYFTALIQQGRFVGRFVELFQFVD
jgi:hypothetical protein